MKYLQKSFSLSMTPTKEGKPRSGTKTFIYCAKCEKVHEKIDCSQIVNKRRK